MSNPKIRPCPQCGNTDNVAVYTYDSGWRHVECAFCNYLGPGEGSIKEAIKSHNKKCGFVAAIAPSPTQGDQT